MNWTFTKFICTKLQKMHLFQWKMWQSHVIPALNAHSIQYIHEYMYLKMSTGRLPVPHMKEHNEQVGNSWNILYTWDIKPLKVEYIPEKYYSIMKEYWVPKYDYNYWV